MNFDEGLHACQGAPNPFSAAGHVTLVPAGPGRAKAAHFAGISENRPVHKKSAMLFDGVNLPAGRGTVSMLVRWSGKRS